MIKLNKLHLKALKEINENLIYKQRFKGGMSNFTYLVEDEVTGEQFVFRFPGSGASNFVDYQTEYLALEEAFELGLTSETVYFDAKTGIKLVKYIPGENFIEVNGDYRKAYDYLKRFHTSNFRKLKPYNHLERLDSYEELHDSESPQYIELKQFFLQLYTSVLKQYAIKPCHNDAQRSNFISMENGQVFLVDYEYAAINDPLYDYACFGNVDLDDALDLLSYTSFDDREEPLLRLYGWRMFQCLQWYNVAAYKHQIGLGESLDIDFDKVSKKYLVLANTLKTLIENYD